MRGGLGSRGVLSLPKEFGMPTGYARFRGGYTRLAAEILADYYWLGSLCKGLVVNPCHSPKEVFKGPANPGTKGDTTCGESVQPLQSEN